jgi:hypothetical protein
MPTELYRQLLADVLCALKEGEFPASHFFASEEEFLFFRSIEKVAKETPTLPKIPPVMPLAIKTPNVKAPPVKKSDSPIDPLHNPDCTIGSLGIHKQAPQAAKSVENKEEAFAEIRTLLKKIAPHLPLIDKIPEDTQAKRIANAWQEPICQADIAVLLLGENRAEEQFLHNLAQGISRKLCPAQLIRGVDLEKEKKWDLFLQRSPLKWLICSPRLYQCPDLLRFYRENPATKTYFLEEKNLLLLSPIASYLNNPALKAPLWEKLCQIVSSP